MNKIWYSIFFVICSVNFVFSAEPAVRIIEIELSDRNQIQNLYQLKLTITDAQGNFVRALATDQEIEAIREKGLQVQILFDDYRQEMPWLSDPDFLDYHNYAELVAEMNQLVLDHPEIARLYDYGNSVQGRDLLCLKISKNPELEEDEPEFRILGAHHGNETIANEIAIYMANLLTDNYGTDPRITYLVDHREIWIMPMPNPDGVERGTRTNANNVDLNRDHGYMWDGWGGSPGPISQPENQSMRRLAIDNNFAISLAFHSSAQYINYLWDYSPHRAQDDDLIVDLSWGYANYSGYTPINGWDWYEVHGSCQDEEYGCNGILGWTIETPQPAPNGIQGVCEDNAEAIMYMMTKAGQGIEGVVTDAITGNPIPAKIDIDEIGWPIYNDAVLGDYHRVLLPGTYTVRAWANGYQSQSVSGIVVNLDNATVVHFNLKPESDSLYAFKVVYALIEDPQNSYNNYSLTPWCLGPADDKTLSIGVAGEIVLDMGEGTEIVDGPGMDVRVYEGGFVAEYFDCYVSNNWNGPWSLLGRSKGSSNFDIASSGLTSARYVRIVDDGNGNANESYPGYDLEAVRNKLPLVTISGLCDQASVARGGNLNLSIRVFNNSDIPQTVQVWAEVYFPNGAPYQGNPVVGPTWVTLPAHRGGTQAFFHTIPLNAPLGDYTYQVKVGTGYPEPILDRDYFRFTVTQ